MHHRISESGLLVLLALVARHTLAGLGLFLLLLVDCLHKLVNESFDRSPALGKAENAARGFAAIVAAVASGQLTPSEAGELSEVVDTYARALLANELEGRVTALESEHR